MTTITSTWGRGPASSGQRRQLILLAVLGVVLALLLVWQLPKLVGGSGSSSRTTATTASEVAPAAIAASAPTGVPGSAVAQTSAAAPALSAGSSTTRRGIPLPLAGNGRAGRTDNAGGDGRPRRLLRPDPAEKPAAQPATPTGRRRRTRPTAGATKTPAALPVKVSRRSRPLRERQKQTVAPRRVLQGPRPLVPPRRRQAEHDRALARRRRLQRRQAHGHGQPRPAGHADEHRDRSRGHPPLRAGDLRHRHDLAAGPHQRGARNDDQHHGKLR